MEELNLQMHRNPWAKYRREEWKDVTQLKALVESESLEATYGTFFDQRFVDYLGQQSFEKQFYSKDSGVAIVNEWVRLVGGLDQGVVLPSVSWFVGVRTREGTEFGVGPNVTPAGVGLVLAAGDTLRTGVMNVPMNITVVLEEVQAHQLHDRLQHAPRRGAARCGRGA